MNLLALVLPLALMSSAFAPPAPQPDHPEGLDQVVSGLKSSREILELDMLPASYLQQLQVPNPNVILNGPQRYALARQLLDVYHLGQALTHQSHFVPAQSPIIQLAEFNFPNMVRYRTESGANGGYLTHRFDDFFASDEVSWEVGSSYSKAQK